LAQRFSCTATSAGGPLVSMMQPADLRPPAAAPCPAAAVPEALEPIAMPPDYRGRLDDRQGVPPELQTMTCKP
jgi:hypothetical protein